MREYLPHHHMQHHSHCDSSRGPQSEAFCNFKKFSGSPAIDAARSVISVSSLCCSLCCLERALCCQFYCLWSTLCCQRTAFCRSQTALCCLRSALCCRFQGYQFCVIDGPRYRSRYDRRLHAPWLLFRTICRDGIQEIKTQAKRIPSKLY